MGQELGELDGLTYVSFPKHLEIPEQPEEIVYDVIELTPELREALKAINPYCKCVDNQLRNKIRERYDGEDEMYLTRICVGNLMGVYEFRPGEQEEVAAYTKFVEELRDWARDERAKIGL